MPYRIYIIAPVPSHQYRIVYWLNVGQSANLCINKQLFVLHCLQILNCFLIIHHQAQRCVPDRRLLIPRRDNFALPTRDKVKYPDHNGSIHIRHHRIIKQDQRSSIIHTNQEIIIHTN